MDVFEKFKKIIKNKDCSRHIKVIGEAGCGKTNFLLALFNSLKGEANLIPVYVNLNPITEEAYPISRYIADKYFSYSGELNFSDRIYSMIENDNNNYYILMVDSFTTMNLSHKSNVIEEIKKLADFHNISLFVAMTRDYEYDCFNEFKKFRFQSPDNLESLFFYKNIEDKSNETLIKQRERVIKSKYGDTEVRQFIDFIFEIFLPCQAQYLLGIDVKESGENLNKILKNRNDYMYNKFKTVVSFLEKKATDLKDIALRFNEFLYDNSILDKDLEENYYFSRSEFEDYYYSRYADTKENYIPNNGLEKDVSAYISNNYNFVRNEDLGKAIDRALKLEKPIIVQGVGGFGKTTLINHKRDIMDNMLVIDRRNHSSWNTMYYMIGNSEKKYVVIDNFRRLSVDDYKYVSNFASGKSLIFLCRSCDEKLINHVSFINCESYRYPFLELINDKEKYNENVIKLLKVLPSGMRSPLFFKLIFKKMYDVEILKNLLQCCVDNAYNSPMDKITSFLEIYFSGIDEDIKRYLIAFSIVIGDMAFKEEHVVEFFTSFKYSGNQRIKEKDYYLEYIKKVIKNEIFFGETNNGRYYFHSIFSDYFVHLFDKYSDEEKKAFFCSDIFSTVIANANQKLKSGISIPYQNKIAFLSFLYSLQSFIVDNLSIVKYGFDDYELEENELKIKLRPLEFINSYTFLLTKSYNNTFDIKEQIRVQEKICDLMYKLECYFKSFSDLFFSRCGAFLNVLSKIKMVNLLTQYNKETIEDITELFKKHRKCVDEIQNKSLREIRDDVYQYTYALFYYKRAILFDPGIDTEFSNSSYLWDKALGTAKTSLEYCIPSIIDAYIKDENISKKNDEDINSIFSEYKFSSYKRYFAKMESGTALFNRIRSYFCSLDLICLIELMMVQSEEQKRKVIGKIDFIKSELNDRFFVADTDDKMRARDLLLLKISALEKGSDYKSAVEEVIGNQYQLSIDNEIIYSEHFELLKYLVIDDYKCNVFSKDLLKEIYGIKDYRIDEIGIFNYLIFT